MSILSKQRHTEGLAVPLLRLLLQGEPPDVEQEVHCGLGDSEKPNQGGQSGKLAK